MKKTLLTLSTVLCLSLPSHALDLLSLGSTGLTIDTNSSTSVNYSQSASALTWTGSQGFGDAVFGSTSSFNWSAVPQFGIRMTLTGSNPNLSFSLQLYNGDGKQALYGGTTDGLTVGIQGEVPLTFSTSDPGFTLASIAGAGIQWDEAGTVTGSMAAITSYTVPEPSTYALLAMSGAAFGGYVIRRRRR